jgi:hypothetical protein
VRIRKLAVHSWEKLKLPRKPKISKQKISVPIEGRLVDVTLTPPSGRRTSWYAYWNGLLTSKSTGHSDLAKAKNAVADMLKNGGRKSEVGDVLLSDAEFEEIQRHHFGKKQDPLAQKRSARSLIECLDAISAFKEITGLSPITTATPADCERFQIEALEKPKNWRSKHPKSKKEVETLSPNTVVKWSIGLRAAFERANRKAGKKCIHSVVDSTKLLTANPWDGFTWIEGSDKPIRRFDAQELVSLLDYFDEKWPGVTVAPAFVKVCLWSWSRREEVSCLQWNDLRDLILERHFESVGKWGVKKWFRLPERLFQDLQGLRIDSPYVFGAYPDQLRTYYKTRNLGRAAAKVRSDFKPANLGEWMYRQVSEWSKTLENGNAYLHVFRKTSLQHARRGEDVNQLVASDASLTTAVMMVSYAEETSEELQQKSNRTFRRIRASLPLDVSTRYGAEESPFDRLVEQIDLARSREDWTEMARLSAELVELKRSTANKAD